jgi:rhodanese-related sulfurtransferase
MTLKKEGSIMNENKNDKNEIVKLQNTNEMFITAEKLLKRLNNGEATFLLDVRSEDKFNVSHLEHPNAVVCRIGKEQFSDDNETPMDTLPKDALIVVLCTTGNSASRVSNVLRKEGYQVAFLEGGMTAWNEYLK